jgi:hypothetical protein
MKFPQIAMNTKISSKSKPYRNSFESSTARDRDLLAHALDPKVLINGAAPTGFLSKTKIQTLGFSPFTVASPPELERHQVDDEKHLSCPFELVLTYSAPWSSPPPPPSTKFEEEALPSHTVSQ